MVLTAKQEAFASAIANGKTQADAYRSAYNAENMKESTLWSNASRLMADSKVAARVEDLRKQLENKQLWTREMSVKALIGAYKEGNPTAKIAAVKELNAMHGFNAPIKTENKIEVSGKEGVLVIGATMTPEEWAVAAKEQQAALTKDAD